MVLDEGDGRQLFAELLQHDHPLQERHVVNAATTSTEVRSAFGRPAQETSEKHLRDPLRLQPQQSFPHEQQLGGEIRYTLNPHHEISDHLTPKHDPKNSETRDKPRNNFRASPIGG